jgi:hypothetical protein
MLSKGEFIQYAQNRYRGRIKLEGMIQEIMKFLDQIGRKWDYYVMGKLDDEEEWNEAAKAVGERYPSRKWWADVSSRIPEEEWKVERKKIPRKTEQEIRDLFQQEYSNRRKGRGEVEMAVMQIVRECEVRMDDELQVIMDEVEDIGVWGNMRGINGVDPERREIERIIRIVKEYLKEKMEKEIQEKDLRDEWGTIRRIQRLLWDRRRVGKGMSSAQIGEMMNEKQMIEASIERDRIAEQEGKLTFTNKDLTDMAWDVGGRIGEEVWRRVGKKDGQMGGATEEQKKQWNEIMYRNPGIKEESDFCDEFLTERFLGMVFIDEDCRQLFIKIIGQMYMRKLMRKLNGEKQEWGDELEEEIREHYFRSIEVQQLGLPCYRLEDEVLREIQTDVILLIF